MSNKTFFLIATLALCVLCTAVSSNSIFNKPTGITIFDKTLPYDPSPLLSDETSSYDDRFYNLFEDEEQELDAIDGGVLVANIPTFDHPKDALAFYFGESNTSTEEENLQFIAQLRTAAQNDPNIALHRNSKTQMVFGMDSGEYDALAESYRNRLIKLAGAVGLTDFSLFQTSYDELIEACREQLINLYDVMEYEDFEVLVDELNLLDEGNELFIQSFTLLPSDAEDLLLQGIVNLDPMLKWASSHLLSHKCVWCKKLAGYIRTKACGKAGDVVCKFVAGFAAEILAPIVIKFGCGAPLNLSSHLSNLCQKGVRWIQGKTNFTDSQICQAISFGTIHVPKHNGFVFTCSARNIVIGSLC